ncbi:hypothetical protein GN244_ATG04297 [Phytophthora infestans]|uniref:Uncharacterized protein n=1 Tax=Phytophthora infestans TaxID=4787 RepID=A0A833SYM2_PHYIN|nr:hypothetical protein GN244_ATG04297 [Phytophthora infestans]
MATAGSSNATLLLVTGLVSVGMAAIGFYYLQMSSKKPSANDSETGNSVATTSSSTINTNKETVAVTSVVTLKPTPPSPKESSKTIEKIVKSPIKEVEPPVAAQSPINTASSPKLEVAASPTKEIAVSPKEETPKSSPKTEVEPPALELPKPVHASPKQTPQSPKKNTDDDKKETDPKKAPVSPVKTPKSPKKAPNSPVKAPESPVKAPESPKKAVESPKKEASEPAPAVDDAVKRMLCEDLIISQAITETADAFTEELLEESIENVALEQEEYVQVEMTRSMTLSPSTPELINIEDAVAKTEEHEVAHTCEATQDEESIVQEEQEQDETSYEPTEPAAAALASPKSSVQSSSWEAIASPEVKAQEPVTSLSLDAPTEDTEALSINVPVENTEACYQDKDASSPVSSGGSSPGSKRNRNRSKKSKSKRKKAKKHPKFKA